MKKWKGGRNRAPQQHAIKTQPAGPNQLTVGLVKFEPNKFGAIFSKHCPACTRVSLNSKLISRDGVNQNTGKPTETIQAIEECVLLHFAEELDFCHSFHSLSLVVALCPILYLNRSSQFEGLVPLIFRLHSIFEFLANIWYDIWFPISWILLLLCLSNTFWSRLP